MRRQWRAILIGSVVLAASSVAPAAENDGIVKGTVGVPADAGSPRNVVVYLDGTIGTPTPRTVRVDQKGEVFLPHVVAVPVGGSVEFTNTDPFLHNVFSTSTAKRFDLGMFGQGQSRTVTFDTAGVVEVRCNVHPKMQAYVVVRDNDYFAIPDEQGNFQITGIPRGRYKLVAWHPTLKPVQTWVNLDEARIQSVKLQLKN
jgi:plastocyanin